MLRSTTFALLLAGGGGGLGCATAGITGGDDTVGGNDGGASGTDSSIPRFDGGNPSPDAGNPSADSGVSADGGSQPPDGGSPPPDGSSPPDSSSTCVHAVASSCGLAPQCDCSNQTCDITDLATGAAQCVGHGNRPQGHACNATGDCAVELTCRGGACRPYCAVDGQACGVAGTGACVQKQNASGAPITNLKVCSIDCKLDDAASCGTMSSTASDPVATCVVYTNNTVDCRKGGRSTSNCDTTTLCAPGYTCAGAAGSGTCYKWCQVSQQNCSGFFQICNSFAPTVVVNGTEFGYCN